MPKPFTCTQVVYSQLPNQRWGIFYGDCLLASIGSQQEAKRIVQHLQKRLQSSHLPSPIASTSIVIANAQAEVAQPAIPTSGQVPFKFNNVNNDRLPAIDIAS